MKVLLFLAVLSLSVSAHAQTGVNYDDPNMAHAAAFVTDTIDDGVKYQQISEATYIVPTASFSAGGFYAADEGLIHPDGRMPASNERASPWNASR
jgi:hypothetical protein